MKDISFGQYYPVKSVVHRMDARAKLLLAIGYIVMLFFIPTLSNYLNGGGTIKSYLILAGTCFFIALLAVSIAIAFSRVPLGKILKSLRAIIFLVTFMTIISVLFYGGTERADSWSVSWWIFKISLEGIINAGAMTLRLIFLVLGPTLLTLTTTPVELTDGIEGIMSPLKLLRLPVHELALTMGIALRLIPTLIEETGKIMNAQKARCADFESGNLFKKAKALIPVLIPLFISSFRRADDLADAMDSRCYRGATGRTRMKKMHLGARDFVAFIFLTVVFFTVLMLRYNWYGVASWLVGLVG